MDAIDRTTDQEIRFGLAQGRLLALINLTCACMRVKCTACSDRTAAGKSTTLKLILGPDFANRRQRVAF